MGIVLKHKFLTDYHAQIFAEPDYFWIPCKLFNRRYAYTYRNLNLIIQLTVNKLDEQKE